MWGNFSYLISILIFAGTPFLLEFIFGFHLLKPHFKTIGKIVLFWVIITPFIEKVALYLSAWGYNPEKNWGIIILNSPAETLIFSIFVSLVIIFTVYAWTDYEDKGKPIIWTSFYDIFHGTYAIWRRKKAKKT